MMTLLQIVQEVCRRQGLPQPQTIVKNTDATVQQLLGFANEVRDELFARYSWQGVQISTQFPAQNQYNQGSVYTLFPGFKWIVPESFWDFTNRVPVGGPMNSEDWERALALPFTGPYYRYRIQGNNLLLFPAPPAAHTFAVEYLSENCIQQSAANGSTVSKYWSYDDDTPLVNDTIFILGIRWRWRSEKGLPYLEHHKAYEVVVNEMMGHDGGKRKLDIADGVGDAIQPGIWIPAGNWPVGSGN